MKFKRPVVNYLELRPSNIFEDRFRHLFMLLYWPLFGMMFMFLEKVYQRYFPVLGKQYHYVYHPLDDLIPFNELFVIPYMFWFLFIILTLLYTLLYDIDTYRRMMNFFMITYTATVIFYFAYPTAQALRPAVFPRDNFLTDFMRSFYAFDTNTNVCPSMHVIGSFAATFALHHAAGIKPWMKLSAHVVNILICLATVFLKQHSVVDIFVAIPICAVAYVMCFTKKRADIGDGRGGGGKKVSAKI